MDAVSSNSYRTRRMEQRCRGVSFGGRTTFHVPRLAEGGRREAEHRGAMSRGVQPHPHTLAASPSVSMVRVHSLGLFYSPREDHREGERERERQQRLLTVDSLAGGVLMEAEICDLDELTSGQRGEPQPSSSSIPRQVEPRRRRSSASRALF